MSTVLFILFSLVAIPITIFTLEIIFSLFPQRRLNETNVNCDLTVLIPAHNESGTIQKTLVNITSQLSENDRLLVVADNCSDNTASISREHGAEVIERINLENRGKGFALDFGIRHLENSNNSVVIIIDADCLVEDGSLQKLANTAILYNRPVQGLYMMSYNNPSLKQRISEFAWLVKNYIRPLGLSNIGLPCQLMGTGMAFPWSLISTTSLASNNIVEDMKMGLDMALAGHAPLFLASARVTSVFPETLFAEQSQKKRWEHGHLSMIFTLLPKVFVFGVIKRSKNLLAMAFDLVVPPLALLTLVTILLLVSALIMYFISDYEVLLMLSLAILMMLIFSIMIAWLRWGRETVSFTDLLMVPFYVLSKVPLYLSAVFKRQKEWIRTDRSDL